MTNGMTERALSVEDYDAPMLELLNVAILNNKKSKPLTKVHPTDRPGQYVVKCSVPVGERDEMIDYAQTAVYHRLPVDTLHFTAIEDGIIIRHHDGDSSTEFQSYLYGEVTVIIDVRDPDEI